MKNEVNLNGAQRKKKIKTHRILSKLCGFNLWLGFTEATICCEMPRSCLHEL